MSREPDDNSAFDPDLAAAAIARDLLAARDWASTSASDDLAAAEIPKQVGIAMLETAEWATQEPGFSEIKAKFEKGDATAANIVLAVGRALVAWRDRLMEVAAQAIAEERYADVDEPGIMAVAIGSWNRNEALARAHLLVGRAARHRNEPNRAIDALSESISIAREVDPATASVALDDLGLVYNSVGRLDEAVDVFTLALRFEADPTGRLSLIANRAETFTALGEYRRAAADLDEVVEDLRTAGAPVELAIALDNAAIAHAALGELDRAIAMFEEARPLFESAGKPRDILRNAMNRADTFLEADDKEAAKEAFEAAYRVAFAAVDPNLTRYTTGYIRRQEEAFVAARGQLVMELGDEALVKQEMDRCTTTGMAKLQEGLDAQHRSEWETADRLLDEAGTLLSRGGEAAAALEAWNNRGVIRHDRGQFQEAAAIFEAGLTQARELGDARQELIALSNLAALKREGADVLGGTSDLELIATERRLTEALPKVADQLGASEEYKRMVTWGLGSSDGPLAQICTRFGAAELAKPLWESSISAARAQGSDPGSIFRLALRLANRLTTAVSQKEDVGTSPAELAALLEVHPANLRAQLVGHRALAVHVARSDPTAAIEHLRAGADAQRRLRVQSGDARAHQLDQQNPADYRLLASLLADRGEFVEAWTALQATKGQRVLQAIASDQITDLASVQKGLRIIASETGRPAALVDLLAAGPDVRTFVVTENSCVAVAPVSFEGDVLLRGLDIGDIRERERRAVAFCLYDERLRDLIAATERELPTGSTIIVCPDVSFQNLPLHITPIDGTSWGQRHDLSLVAGAGLVPNFTAHPTGRARRAFVAGDSDGSLPGALAECHSVADSLGTVAHVGSDCSLEALQEAMGAGRLDVIHLAVHGRGDAFRGGRAALLFAAQDGPMWVPFQDLLNLGLNAELVVLSGCSTAVAGPLYGQATVSAAQAALEAGAGTVLACLWPVEDNVAAAYMQQFYSQLAPAWESGPADVRAAMSAAIASLQGALSEKGSEPRRDFRNLDIDPDQDEEVDPAVREGVRLAPFVLYGDPVVGG